MEARYKIIISFLLIGAIFFVLGAVSFLREKMRVEREIVSIEEEISIATEESSKIAKLIKDEGNVKIDREKKFKEYEAVLKQLSKDLDAQKAINIETAWELRGTDLEIKRIKSALEHHSEEKNNLHKIFILLENKISTIKELLAYNYVANEELNRRLMELKREKKNNPGRKNNPGNNPHKKPVSLGTIFVK